MEDKEFSWNFERLAGIDHATLQTAEELCRLDELDPKLWGALSCPASGLKVNSRMLALIDTDKDGRIRVPEVVAAARFVCDHLKDPAWIARPEAALPLAALRRDTPAAARLAEAAGVVLEHLGKPDATALSAEDAARAAADVAQKDLKGDGILPPLPSFDPAIQDFIRDALAVTGGVRDGGGEAGINRAIASAFTGTLRAWLDWNTAVSEESPPFGKDTNEAWTLYRELEAKIDDYFLRSELAVYSPAATEALNACPGSPSGTGAAVGPGCVTAAGQPLYAAGYGAGYGIGQSPAALACGPQVDENGLIDRDSLADLPLSRIEGDRPLNLNAGLNPAWRARVERFAALVAPVSGSAESLTRAAWQAVKAAFVPHAELLAKRPAPLTPEPQPGVHPELGPDPGPDGAGQGPPIPPTAKPEDLGEARVREILDSGVAGRFEALVAEDAAVPATSADIARVERIVLYSLHLHELLMNFVSFYQFYSMRGAAAFQAGILYMDGRGCRLCLPVADMDKHAPLASHSQLCLLYCECRRPLRDGEAAEEKRTIVAAMTQGDADLLMEGRNGVFVDNDGLDWDATVVKMVSNPIGLWQAVWQPYKKAGRMITEQIAKFAGNKDDSLSNAVTDRLGSVTATAIQSAPAPAATVTPARQAFDIGRSVGIFAAIGLAIGAIGTALASITSALFALHWWQYPLVLLGLFLLISGPSLVLAWLKLRKRTLGPLLEASGWAVNDDLPINLALGKTLTERAEMPENAKRDNAFDPLNKPDRRPWIILGAALLLGAALAWVALFHPLWLPFKLPFDSPFAADTATGGRAEAPNQDRLPDPDQGDRTPGEPAMAPPDEAPKGEGNKAGSGAGNEARRAEAGPVTRPGER